MAARSSARRAVGGAAVAAAMLAGLAVAIPAPAQAAVDGGAHGWGSDVNGRLGNGATTGDVLTSTATVGVLLGVE